MLMTKGRRKTARVSLFRPEFLEDSHLTISVGGRRIAFLDYFDTQNQEVIFELLRKCSVAAVGGIAQVRGGGKNAQATALRLAIARALVSHNSDLAGTLRGDGELNVDIRQKERKKTGLRGARRTKQRGKR